MEIISMSNNKRIGEISMVQMEEHAVPKML